MALDNDTLLTNCATDIVDTVMVMPAPTTDPVVARARVIAQLKTLLQKIMQYIVANGVVTLDASTRTIETYVAGTGDHGGSLVSATGGPVSGSVVDAKAATGGIL